MTTIQDPRLRTPRDRRNVIVYVAGPFRAETFWGMVENIREAERAALAVWRAGFTAICPHLNTANFSGCLPSGTWLEGDFEIVRRCDVVLLLPKWRSSVGTTEEREVALANGVALAESIEDIEHWWNAREE